MTPWRVNRICTRNAAREGETPYKIVHPLWTPVYLAQEVGTGLGTGPLLLGTVQAHGRSLPHVRQQLRGVGVRTVAQVTTCPVHAARTQRVPVRARP